MASYPVEITNAARREIRDLPGNVRQLIFREIQSLEKDARPYSSKGMKSTKSFKIPNQDKLLEAWEVKLLEEENQPGFYDPQKVLELRDNINKVVKAVIFVYIALGLLDINSVRTFLQNIPLPLSDILQSIPYTIINILIVGIQFTVIYFPIKA